MAHIPHTFSRHALRDTQNFGAKSAPFQKLGSRFLSLTTLKDLKKRFIVKGITRLSNPGGCVCLRLEDRMICQKKAAAAAVVAIQVGVYEV